MEGRLLARARAKQEKIRNANRSEENRRQGEVYAAVPEIRRIDGAIRALMSELVGLALGKKGRTGPELEAESLALQERRRQLLRENGWAEDYLEPIYACPKGRDTGFVPGGGMCECLVTLYKQEQTAELSPLLKNGEETFARFRLDYYSAVAPEGQTAPRRQMERVFAACKQYADGFGEGSTNLLFTGAPGLGKTFLSAAIARVVAEKGHSVAYDTASGLLSVFEREKFGRDEDKADAASRVRQLLSCDLLILDDLGTEMPTAFNQSALYNLIDGRLRSGKKTVISTNLNPEELTARYGSQLGSRLNGEYLRLEFLGRDIRAIRKERSYGRE